MYLGSKDSLMANVLGQNESEIQQEQVKWKIFFEKKRKKTESLTYKQQDRK